MKLYLVQHGKQNPEEIDSEKNLSPAGKKDVEKVASFLKQAGIRVPEIFHSGKARVKQTAEIIAQAINLKKGVVQKEGLAPMDPIPPTVAKIEARAEDLMIVGHLPFLNKLASFLISGDTDRECVLFKQGGVLCLEKTEGIWRVAWMIIPDII